MLSVAALAVVFAVGCGGEKTDISAAVVDTNKTLKPAGASMDCPDEVDGGKGTKVDCTLKGTKSGKTAPIQIKLGEDTIDPVSQKQLVSALRTVTGR